MIGTTLGHYRIVEKIGEGGMGEVYRAHDERLDRDVAIKVLPAEVADKPDRLARFEREAKAVAKLNHPNILDIYELGDYEGRPFMATELLEGETLRELLGGGSLGWRKATEIGAAIADGLGAAHEAGICHRDLKPSNVFLTADGRVKVLDFGLARHEDADADDDLTRAPTITKHTDPGTVLGTVGYMSPEQVRGETADHRSDIFSLGCVLYEMVSAQRAFTGDSAIETMNAILKEEPSDVSDSSVEVPPELAGTIRRCLEKKPQARFQSASDLAYNLRTISSASTPSAPRDKYSVAWYRKGFSWVALAAAVVAVVAIAMVGLLRLPRDEGSKRFTMGATLEWVAVEPFENRTGDASLDSLGQRTVDLIVQQFSDVGRADGVLTLDAAPYPPGSGTAREKPPRQDSAVQPVGGKGPHVLVSGSYYLDGEELEFQAKLTDYDTGELVYAFKPISATRTNASEAMDDLRERIVAAVQFHWSNDYDVRLNTPPSSYEALREFEHGWRTWGTDFEETIAAFSRALDLDPNFHTPRFPLIIVYLNIGEREEAARELAAAEGRRGDFTAFERTSLDWCEAKVKMMRTKALTFQRRLVKLAPHIAWLRYNLSVETYRLNRPRETIEILAPLLPTFQDESLPYAWFALGRASAAHHLLGEYERHLEWANVGLEMFPDVGQFFSHKCAALAGMGRPDAVNGVIDDCSRVQLREDTFDFCTVAIYAALELRAHGHRPESDALALRATEWCERQMIGGDFKASDPDGLRRYSWALRVAGRWDEARAPLMELKERERWPIGTAGALGLIAARTDDRAEAWRVFNDFPESDSSSAPAARCYWRACIASYLGEKDVAVELLKEGYSKGLGHTITLHVDVDLEPLWDYPPFQELIEPKG